MTIIENVEGIGESRWTDSKLKAVHCKKDVRMFWIPFKAIHEDSDVYKKDTQGKLILHHWFDTSEIDDLLDDEL